LLYSDYRYYKVSWGEHFSAANKYPGRKYKQTLGLNFTEKLGIIYWQLKILNISFDLLWVCFLF
jgi:hypothetical protein